MKKILFLLPPSSEKGLRYQPSHHPIVTATLAGVARDNGAMVAVMDSMVSGDSRQKMVEESIDLEPDIIAIIPYEYRREIPLEHTKKMLVMLREKGVKAKIGVLNCPLGSLECRRLVEQKQADFVVFGDSELVVRNLARFERIAGAGILVDSEQGLQEEEPVHKMDWTVLGTPAWDLFAWENYVPSAHRYRKSPVFPVMSARVCPFGCDFCPHTLFHASDVYSPRPVPDVIKEISDLQQKYGAQHIEFYDPTFAVHREHCRNLVAELGKLGIAWSCYSRSDLLDKELLQEMADAGCHSVLFGVESGNQEVLTRTQKDLSLGDVQRMVQDCKELGIRTIASFIIGLPLDTPKTLQETIDFACQLNPTYAQFHQARDFFEHDEWKELGTIDQQWKEMASSINGQAYIPNGLSQEEIQKWIRKAYLSFYGSPLKMLELSNDVQGREDLKRYWVGIKQIAGYFRGLE